MTFLDNEKYLLDLLVDSKLLTPEQVEAYSLKKGAQRQLLQRKLGGSRAGVGKRSALDQPDVVDILVSLQFGVAGKKKQVLTEETIMRTVAKDRKLPFKKLDPLE
ncbi:MAG: type II/IV secretion system protein, partial [Deltaproteobacteria bacterium]|nr:type II/IV secretion system protein [Deltaproteobacteria bacterium]